MEDCCPVLITCLQTDCVEYAETGQPRVPLSSKREVSHKTEERERCVRDGVLHNSGGISVKEAFHQMLKEDTHR